MAERDDLQARIAAAARPLTDRQRAFVHEYMTDFCGTQAAIRAGYAEDRAASTASRLLRKPEIRAFRDVLMEERFEAVTGAHLFGCFFNDVPQIVALEHNEKWKAYAIYCRYLRLQAARELLKPGKDRVTNALYYDEMEHKLVEAIAAISNDPYDSPTTYSYSPKAPVTSPATAA